MQAQKSKTKGFSLIEILVAVAIFSMVMLVAVGALLTMIDANRKAQSTKSVMNNLSFALESMARNARLGTDFHCETDLTPTNVETPLDCPTGGILFAFEGQFGVPGAGDQFVYIYNGTQIERSTDGGLNFIPVTASEVIIDDLTFYVAGSENGGQPRVVITIQGRAGLDERVQTTFRIQTQATQRVIDI